MNLLTRHIPPDRLKRNNFILLACLLTLALFVLLGLIAVCTKAIKHVQSRSAHNSRTAVMPR